MKRLFLSIAIILCLVGYSQEGLPERNDIINYGTPKTYKVGAIKVTGAKYLDHGIIRSISGLVLGSEIEIPGEETAKAIRNLWKQGLFSDVELKLDKVEGEYAFFNIVITEKARVSKFVLNGIKKGHKEEIDEKLERYKNRPFTGGVESNIKNILEDFYAEKGYLNPDIKISSIDDSLYVNSTTVYVDVDKGGKVKIENIDFIGREEGDLAKMKKAMAETREKVYFKLFKPDDKRVFKDKEKFKKTVGDIVDLNIEKTRKFLSDRVNLSFKASKFNEDSYEADKRALINYYNSIGYRDATILKDTVYYVNKSNLKIEIEIEEGNRYYFRNIYWKGNAKYSDETLSKVLSIRRGDIYNRELLDKKLNLDPTGADVSSLYYDDGYLFFSVNPSEIAVVNDSIDLEIRINEGPQATIRNVIIKGNDKTHDHVIRRELYTKPGRKFSRTDLIRSQRQLANLGFFDAEQMGVLPLPNPEDGTVDIEYSLVEKSADQIELSAGWGGSQGLIGTLGLSFNNFSWRNMFKKGSWSPLPTGDGQKLSIRVQSNGKRYQSYNFSFTEPWLGGKKPNAFTLSAFRQRFQDLDGDNNVEGRQITNGLSVGIGTRLKKPDDNFIFQGLLSYQSYKLENLSQFIASEGTTVSNGNFNNLSFKLTLARNSLDQPLFPRNGANITTSVQFTLPYSYMRGLDYDDPNLSSEEKFKWVEYHKWRFTAEWYTSLGRSKKDKKPVLKAAAKFGYLGFYNRKLGLSPFERFEVGGNGLPSNVTLFGTETISQRGYNEYSQTGGDAIFNKFTLELRYPFSLNPSATVYGLVFVEAGNSYPNFREYNPFKLNRSVGFGVRAFLPMFGLLGLDYGIRFDDVTGSPIENASGFFDYIGKNGEITIILGFEPE